jgi:hypothetical protein
MSGESATKDVQVGDKMPDGTVYAGISPDTGEKMYTTPADAPLLCIFNRAGHFAEKLDAHGHHDWRVPTKNELSVLFQNSTAIGGFHPSDTYTGGWYHSSSPLDDDYAWAQRFSDGHQSKFDKGIDASLRCVRG